MDNPIRVNIAWNGKGRYADYIRLRKDMRIWLQENLTETTFLMTGFDILFAYEQDIVAFNLRFPYDLYSPRQD